MADPITTVDYAAEPPSQRGSVPSLVRPPSERAAPLPLARVEVALLDRDGVIVSVNESWEHFGRENGGDPTRCGVGQSYLAACAAGYPDPVSRRVSGALRSAISGTLPRPLKIEVPCHSPDTARVFDVLISSRLDHEGQNLGATVTLSESATSHNATSHNATSHNATSHNATSHNATSHNARAAEDPPATLSVANPARVRKHAVARPAAEDDSAGPAGADLPPNHDQIAADLQDHVVSELFSTGIGLEAIAEGLGRGDQLRVLVYVESLDATILRIRSSILQLQRCGHGVHSLRQRVLRAFDDATTVPGLQAKIELSDLSGNSVPADVADDAVAAVREALATATHYADAGSVSVQVALSDSYLGVDVTDDGHSGPDAVLSGALMALRQRAELHGGSLERQPLADGGNRLRWIAPLNPAD